jgi:hypothetical protein
MRLTVIGVTLVAFGVLYLRRPTLYRRGIWLKTSIAIRFLSEENYEKYMKAFGVIYILAGIALIVWEHVLARLFA